MMELAPRKLQRYTLEANNSGAYVFAHYDDGRRSATDGTRSVSGKGVKPKTLAGLRKYGVKMAKHNKVPFEDRS